MIDKKANVSALAATCEAEARMLNVKVVGAGAFSQEHIVQTVSSLKVDCVRHHLNTPKERFSSRL